MSTFIHVSKLLSNGDVSALTATSKMQEDQLYYACNDVWFTACTETPTDLLDLYRVFPLIRSLVAKTQIEVSCTICLWLLCGHNKKKNASIYQSDSVFAPWFMVGRTLAPLTSICSLRRNLMKLKSLCKDSGFWMKTLAWFCFLIWSLAVKFLRLENV